MTNGAASAYQPSAKERLREELRRYLAVSAYLYVCFAAILFYKSAILSSIVEHYLPFGLAAGKALIPGGDGIARGETLQCMHLSEVAFWPKGFSKENFNGLIQALPDTDGTMCFVESTANGLGNQFHSLWEGAVAGTNGFRPFFSAWFESAEYREEPPATFQRTPHEQELAAKFGLDDEQLYWRRRKVAAVGLDLFTQEYPCTAEEAFITSGRPVFDAMYIAERKNRPLSRCTACPSRSSLTSAATATSAWRRTHVGS